MSKREIVFASQFKRDLKKHFLALASAEWAEVLYCLLHDKALPEKYRDHALHGEYKDSRDCHVKPDLVLIYRRQQDEIQLLRLGTHAELF